MPSTAGRRADSRLACSRSRSRLQLVIIFIAAKESSSRCARTCAQCDYGLRKFNSQVRACPERERSESEGHSPKDTPTFPRRSERSSRNDRSIVQRLYGCNRYPPRYIIVTVLQTVAPGDPSYDYADSPLRSAFRASCPDTARRSID